MTTFILFALFFFLVTIPFTLADRPCPRCRRSDWDKDSWPKNQVCNRCGWAEPK